MPTWFASEDKVINFAPDAVVAGGIGSWIIEVKVYDANNNVLKTYSTSTSGVSITDATACTWRLTMPLADTLSMWLRPARLQARRIDSGHNTVLYDGGVTVGR